MYTPEELEELRRLYDNAAAGYSSIILRYPVSTTKTNADADIHDDDLG